MKPPDCDVCDERFEPPDGALVTFAARPSDTEWRERAERERLVGHPPDTGWFCGEHAVAAAALAHLTFPEAMAELRSPRRAPAAASPPPGPSEPRTVARARWTEDRYRHEVRFERPAPVAALDGLIARCSDSYQERWHRGPLFPRREIVDGIELVHLETSLPPSREELPDPAADAAPRTRAVVTASVDGDDVVAVRLGRGLDHQHRRLGMWFAELLLMERHDWVSVGCDICGDHAAAESFGTIVAFADWPRSVRSGPEPARSDGFPSFVGRYCERHAGTADRLARVRRGDAEVLMRHDLLAADLGEAFIGDAEERVHLPIARTEVGLLYRLFADLLPSLAAALGVGLPALTERSHRTWSRMDGCEPPHCPFSTETTRRGEAGPLSVSLDLSGAYWSDDAAARKSATLAVEWAPNGRSPDHDPERWGVRLAAGSHDHVGPEVFVDTLWWRRPLVPEAVPVVAAFVESLT